MNEFIELTGNQIGVRSFKPKYCGYLLCGVTLE
jgi:hypothetical protein